MNSDWTDAAADLAFKAVDQLQTVIPFPVTPGVGVTVEKSVTIRGPSSGAAHGAEISETISAAVLKELFKEHGVARVSITEIRVSTGMAPMEPVVVNLRLQQAGVPDTELFSNGIVNPAPGGAPLVGAVITPKWTGELPVPAFKQTTVCDDTDEGTRVIVPYLRTVGVAAMYNQLAAKSTGLDGFVTLDVPPPHATSFEEMRADPVDKALAWWLIHGAHRILADERAKLGSAVDSGKHLIYARTFGNKNYLVVNKAAALKYLKDLEAYSKHEHHFVVGAGNTSLVCKLTKATPVSWSQVLVPGASNAITLHIKGEVWPTHANN